MPTASSYSIMVFVVVLITGCILNLLRRHFIFQLTGMAFFFTYAFFTLVNKSRTLVDFTAADLYSTFLPMLGGISACLISMVLGFWIFPPIRKRFKS